ncbi:hypothetical protein GCM10011496_09550 [Polaromonas eurypsychrophila]|uniref:Uncharacterized protein n=1 Tax=Polaromonas eurypsychrophila TaxID=1614635 RepID=A0A916WEL1_9BURK|nr:hypothetical protein GCM10011496_09550 [Polaromonas eurypsychrophila]
MAVLLPLLLHPWAQALQWDLSNPFPNDPLAGVARGITLSGELLPGDTGKLVQWMQARPADAWHSLGRVELKITGGDTREALLLADTLAPLYPYTVAAGSSCTGPCALVWLAGAWRMLTEGRIGLRAVPPAALADSNANRPADAPSAFDLLPSQLRSYALKQGLPLPFTERWLSGSSGEVYWLSEQDINATGTWPPYYYARLRAKCPALAATEESFHALRRCAARLVISQKAFAFDKLMAGVDDAWWNENRDVFKSAPR